MPKGPRYEPDPGPSASPRQPTGGKSLRNLSAFQVGQEATFHVDHILAEANGGETDEQNLALACVSCSLRKEARQSGVDKKSAKREPLFDPRRDVWREHFRWAGIEIEGLTPKGRATVELLKLNRPSILVIREEEVLRGRLPP